MEPASPGRAAQCELRYDVSGVDGWQRIGRRERRSAGSDGAGRGQGARTDGEAYGVCHWSGLVPLWGGGVVRELWVGREGAGMGCKGYHGVLV